MLDIMRKQKRSWIILLLLGIGVLAFVMVGVYPKGNQGDVVTIAEVNGDRITSAELENSYQRFLQSYQQLLRGSMSPNEIAQLNLRGEVLNELIQQRLLLQEAQKLGLGATDDELAAGIAANSAFQTGGRFNKNVYQRILRAQGMSPAQFEGQLRDSLTIRKLFSLIQDSMPVTEDELKDRYRLDNEQINLEFIRLKAEEFLPQVKVTDEEIREYYEKNKTQLREPLKVQVRYIAYPIDKFGADFEVTDAQIDEYYNVYRDRRFTDPEQVRFRQISIQSPEGAPAEEKAKARERINKIRKEALSGADFAALAKEHSQDPSAAQGGDMGFVARGEITPGLAGPLFALEAGKISEVLESPYGLHLLRVEEKRPENTKELGEVREEIIAALRRDKGTELAARAIEDDREKVLDGVAFDEIAKNRGLKMTTSPQFGAGEKVEEIGEVEDFYKTSLGLRAKDQIGPIVQGPKGYYLLQLSDRIEPRIPQLEAVKEKVKENLRLRKARELANTRAKDLLDELKTKESLKEVADAHELAIEETGLFPRHKANIPKIGSLQTGQGQLTLSKEKPRADALVIQGDAIYIVALKESIPANLEDFPAAKQTLNQQILGEKRQRALQRLIENLKNKAEIEIHPEFI